MTLAIPSKMKCAVTSAFLALAFVSQASAVFRPLFPFKPAAPSNGELIVIGDELALRTPQKPPPHQSEHGKLDGSSFRR